MAEKQSILGRIGQLVKANINALIDSAEDPKLMLDQLVRDYTNSIAEAETSVAQTLGNLRLAEQDAEEDKNAAAEWGRKAAAASRKADELTTAGDAAGAERWNGLAKQAIGRQLQYEKSVKEAEPMLASQREVAEKLKDGVQLMRTKLEELKDRRDQLIARQRTAAAQNLVQESMSKINVLDPTSELGRFEDKVRREEAMAAGRAELAADSLDAQFASLDDLGDDLEIEARLQQLKGN